LARPSIEVCVNGVLKKAERANLQSFVGRPVLQPYL
jgi:hypothetical protein